MSPLPLEPEDRIRARRAVAENLRWPAGAVDACIELEAGHPGWAVFWTRGWGGSAPPGYRAAHISAPTRELRAATTDELRRLIEEIEARMPSSPAG